MPSNTQEVNLNNNIQSEGEHMMSTTIEHNQPAATRENTVFLTVAAYDNHEPITAVFRKSAEDHGIPIVLCDVGEPWQGFYHHKIAVMGERLKRLREEAGKQFAFILDCRDVVFIEPLESVLAKFNALNDGRTIFNKDVPGRLFPQNLHYLAQAMEESMKSNHARLNAGMIAGSIEAILNTQQRVTELRQELIEGCPRPGIMERLYQDLGTKRVHDDQHLYQIGMVYYPDLFHLDYKKELFALLTTFPKDVHNHSNNPRRHDVINHAAIVHAPILPRRGWRACCEQQWSDWALQHRWQQ